MSGLDNFAAVAEATTPAVDLKKEHAAKITEAFKATLAENGEQFTKVAGTRSNDIQVVNVCGYTNSGSLVEIEKAVGVKGQEGYVPHKVQAAPKSVGYIITNISENPIAYSGTQCELVDGQYVPTAVPMTLAPGATAAIRKSDLVRLLCAPEFGFEASNGKLRPAGALKAKSAEELVCSYTFKFDDAEVSNVTIQIGQQDKAGKWSVKDEYKAIFGDEENAPVKAARVKGEKSNKPSAQALEANYVYRLLNGLA